MKRCIDFWNKLILEKVLKILSYYKQYFEKLKTKNKFNQLENLNRENRLEEIKQDYMYLKLGLNLYEGKNYYEK